MPHLRVVLTVFFAITVIRMTASARRGGNTGVATSSICDNHNCTLDVDHHKHGCPRGCLCTGFDRTSELPKRGFCIPDNASVSNRSSRF
uniref:Evasin n=1 Tax=Rhipicephalus zambeziensis TaxID=60191 RepID=A0A224YE61_9ACAR